MSRGGALFRRTPAARPTTTLETPPPLYEKKNGRPIFLIKTLSHAKVSFKAKRKAILPKPNSKVSILSPKSLGLRELDENSGCALENCRLSCLQAEPITPIGIGKAARLISQALGPYLSGGGFGKGKFKLQLLGLAAHTWNGRV